MNTGRDLRVSAADHWGCRKILFKRFRVGKINTLVAPPPSRPGLMPMINVAAFIVGEEFGHECPDQLFRRQTPIWIENLDLAGRSVGAFSPA